MTLAILLIAVGVIFAVFYFSGRYGGRKRIGTTSLRRRPHSHVTANGRAKIAYPSREDAQVQARKMEVRDGVQMGVYRCDTCAKWHIGH
ncbi:MAG: hypothetical protein HKL86_06630 [Acidimicrobiaceae bacterium]|nr:hypothetical protein [Acidimicrobiaceae bacterium]